MEERITLNQLLSLPYNEVEELITSFIRERVSQAGVDKAVVGLSGGLDSSTVLDLLVRALGESKVVALIMPDPRVTRREDVNDAIELAGKYGVEYYVVTISGIFDSFSSIPFFSREDLISNGNLRARIRMTLLYYYANRYKALVTGTGDRSELLIGYYTKYGDGGVDILPIGSLYKTQVRRLAMHLGLPSKIVNKPSSPGFWLGHLAEEELGIKYEEIDLVLYSIVDRGIDPSLVPKYTGIPRDIVDKVVEMHRKSRHKRVFPPIPRFPWMKKDPLYEF